jgi:hypothetical protein
MRQHLISKSKAGFQLVEAYYDGIGAVTSIGGRGRQYVPYSWTKEDTLPVTTSRVQNVNHDVMQKKGKL